MTWWRYLMIGKQFLRKSSYSFSFLQWLCSLCRFISVVICFLKTYSSYKSCLVILNCSGWTSTGLTMSAIFNFQSLLTVILLLICTCAYIRSLAPSILDRNKTGLLGIFWKCARIGERKSPYVAICCIVMAFSILFIQ